MNYPILKERDNLPAAGVLQKLLNRAGASLRVDGLFGPATLAALLQFQENQRLPQSGLVDEATWAALAAGVSLPILDCIDFWDPELYALEPEQLRRLARKNLPAAGDCGSVEELVEAICGRNRNVFLFRVHGLDMAQLHTAVPPERILRVTGRLRGIFGPYGCVHFLNCRTGRGADGRGTLARIAAELGVPASAGLHDQLAGGLEARRFEGWTVTVMPGKGTLAQWCDSRPEFVESHQPAIGPSEDVSVC